MWKITLQNLAAHRRRLVGTAVAVVLGVAFLAGTLVLGDTMRHGFDQVFSTANAGTDVVVRASSVVGSDQSEQRAMLDPSIVPTVRAVRGVAEVVPSYTGVAQLVGADGEPIGGEGPPTLGGNWIHDESLNPFRLAAGRAPEQAGEVVIDRGAAAAGRLAVGDRTTVLTPEPVEVEVVGTARFGDQDSLGGATYTLFSPDQAEQLFGGTSGRLTSLLVTARPGVSASALASSIARAVPDGVEALTGTELTKEQTDAIGADFLDFFQTFLLVFSGVAMLVATFSIHNTFSVVLAQRTRESALLRALGATRRQVLAATAAETAAVGVFASAVGVLAGVGLAAGLRELLHAVGMGMPMSDLEVGAGSLWTAALVGVVVTVLAGLTPALGASRVAPLAALRAVAIERVGRPRARVGLGVALLGGGLALCVLPALGAYRLELIWIGVGAVAVILGVVAVGPLVARPAARVLGAPIAAGRGVTGRLARDNAMRNPRRSAGTATALMVGVGVVTLFMVFGASISASVDDNVARSLRADLVVQGIGFSGSGLSAELPSRLAGVDGVAEVAGVEFGSVRLDGEGTDVDVTRFADVPAVLDLDVSSGSVGRLRPDELAVSAGLAAERGWRPGDRVEVGFVDGATRSMRIGVVYRSEDFASGAILDEAAYGPHAADRSLDVVLVRLDDGVDPVAASRAIDRAGAPLGAPDSLTRAEFVDEAAGQVDDILMLVYVLLALSILIALMGIANTLSLSIHERIRELGLLRAVGQTRPQTRAMVRWEAVVIAMFGTLSGVAVGVLLGWALVRGASSDSNIGVFSAPIASLAVIGALGGVVGVVAGLRPARRAARIDVLDAISTT